MNYENALNFLLYSYFGIVPKSIYNEDQEDNSKKDEYKDYCIKMIIIKAYGDATGQGAYNTLFNKRISEDKLNALKESSNAAKKESANYIFDEITKIKINSSDNYDEWHKTVCDELVRKYEAVQYGKDRFFTYGNAQKWINMTMKYLWLLGLLPDGVKKEFLHIPVDSYIIDALWENESIVLPLSQGNRSHSYAQPSNYVKPWSKWEDRHYAAYRESICETSCDLSWENNAWIMQSEIRKNKEKTEKYNSFFGEPLSSDVL